MGQTMTESKGFRPQDPKDLLLPGALTWKEQMGQAATCSNPTTRADESHRFLIGLCIIQERLLGQWRVI